MKLRELRLHDFLNHRDTTIRFGGMTVIAGPNAAGKSAIKDAIEMVFTGAARTTDKAGRGSQALVSVGRPNFTVTAEVEVKGEVYTITRAKGGDVGHSLDIRPAVPATSVIRSRT